MPPGLDFRSPIHQVSRESEYRSLQIHHSRAIVMYQNLQFRCLESIFFVLKIDYFLEKQNLKFGKIKLILGKIQKSVSGQHHRGSNIVTDQHACIQHNPPQIRVMECDQRLVSMILEFLGIIHSKIWKNRILGKLVKFWKINYSKKS